MLSTIFTFKKKSYGALYKHQLNEQRRKKLLCWVHLFLLTFFISLSIQTYIWNFMNIWLNLTRFLYEILSPFKAQRIYEQKFLDEILIIFICETYNIQKGSRKPTEETIICSCTKQITNWNIFPATRFL